MGEFIELVPVELAGRGTRIDIPLYESTEEAVNDMYEEIKDQVDEPFAFFGHSSGGLLAYSLACKLKLYLNKQPLHIFLSSISPLCYLNDSDIQFSNLPVEELKARLVSMGRATQELFDDADLFNFFIPPMLVDMKIFEEYDYKKCENNISSNLAIMYGKIDDRVKNLYEWTEFTRGECEFCEFEGGHFFMDNNINDTIGFINDSLSRYIG